MEQLGPGSIEWQLRNRTTERDELQKLVDTYRLESKRLREQLETARKALEQIRESRKVYDARGIAFNALDQIGAVRTGPGDTERCARCGSDSVGWNGLNGPLCCGRCRLPKAGRPPVQPCGHEWRHCSLGQCEKCAKQLAKLTELSAEREQHLRQNKQKFLDDLKSGALENTPSRLALASHILNFPECECDLCGTDAERRGNELRDLR